MIEITDLIEREEALNPECSFAVQAPAGSGKTELLMQRYLRLLSIAERPEEILALTFTRKAAGEMQERILSALTEAQEGGLTTEPHRAKTLSLARAALERGLRLGWELLDNPGRLKVQTIDSFSASLVRQLPVLSRMGGQLAVTDDPGDLYREAARRTIELVEEDSAGGEAVRKALLHMDNSVKALSDRLVVMLGKRDQWIRHVRRKDECDFRPLLEGSLKRAVEEELCLIRSHFTEELGGRIASAGRYAASNLPEGDPVRALSGIAGLPGARGEDLQAWRGVKRLLLTNGNPPSFRKSRGVDIRIGFPPEKSGPGADAKAGFKDLLASLEGNDTLLSSLSRVGVLPDPSFDDESWATLEAILHLLPVARTELLKVFGESGKVDFQAVAIAAIESLGSADDPTDLMLALDMRIRHILVDEYQDTSCTQLELLKALTAGWTPGDGRTLFVVGDPMQSIYRFREADVGLFLDARSLGIGDVRLKPLVLKTNFRSQANIVEWVNGAFADAFPKEEERLTGAVVFEPSAPARPALPGKHPRIRLFSSRDDAAEAEDILSIIRGVDSGSSIGVLCRSRAHLDSIVEALKKEGIPFKSQGLDRLGSRPVVRDLLSLLRALSHPFDRIAWLSILRAPWCGLTLKDLHALVSGEPEAPVTSLATGGAGLEGLSEDGRVRLEMTMDRVHRALELRGRTGLRRLIEGLWIDLGGPAALDGPSDMEDAGRFLDLLESMEEAGRLDSIAALARRTEALYADHGGEGANIELMTMHKAKGLEFDVVILPGLGKKARPEDKGLILWMERGEDLIIAPVEKRGGEEGESAVYGYIRDLERRRLENETVRLLYVAATRARKELYLLGHLKTAEDGSTSVEQRSLLNIIGRSLSNAMTVPVEPEEREPEPVAPRIRRLTPGWRAPEPAPAIGAVRSVRDVKMDEPEFYWAGEGIRHLGTVVHRYLCRISKEGLEAWDGRRIENEAARIKGALRTLGLNASEAEGLSLEGVRMIKKALSSGRGRWILSKHPEGSVEEPVTGFVNGEFVRAVIDRTFVDNGERWIVDYKTGGHEGGSLEAFLQSERERYAAQLERYAAVLKAAGETRRIRKGLFYPALGEWVEV